MTAKERNVVLDYDEYLKRKLKEKRVPKPDEEHGCHTNRGGKQVNAKYAPETCFNKYPEEVPYNEGLLSGKTLFRRLWERERGINVNNRTRYDDRRRYQKDKAKFVKSLVSKLRLPESMEREVMARAMSEEFRGYGSYGGLTAGVLAIARIVVDKQRSSMLDDFEYPEDKITNDDELRLARDFRRLVERNDVDLKDAEKRYRKNQHGNGSDEGKDVMLRDILEAEKTGVQEDFADDDALVVGDIRPQDVQPPA
jgi:hypothetical protein